MQKLLRTLPHARVGQRIHHLYDGWNFEMRQVVATVLKHGFHIGLDVGPVSYTHLTLPTNRLV